MLSRLALSVVGAGFVVGIRMVSEWFPPSEVGTAEGVYGGWGNFGAAAAAFSLPDVRRAFFGGDDGWRWSILLTGVIAAGVRRRSTSGPSPTRPRASRTSGRDVRERSR